MKKKKLELTRLTIGILTDAQMTNAMGRGTWSCNAPCQGNPPPPPVSQNDGCPIVLPPIPPPPPSFGPPAQCWP